MNGVLMFGMTIIMVRLLMGVRGSLAEFIGFACFAEVRGATIPVTAVVRFVAGFSRTAGAGFTGFEW